VDFRAESHSESSLATMSSKRKEVIFRYVRSALSLVRESTGTITGPLGGARLWNSPAVDAKPSPDPQSMACAPAIH
jgi:hypothetical protein